MRVFAFLSVSLLVLSSCIYVNARDGGGYDEVATKNHSFDISDVEDVDIYFNAGEFTIVGTDSDILSTHVSVRCKEESEKCSQVRDELNWGFERERDQLSLVLMPTKIKGSSNISIIAKVEIPKSKNLAVSMVAGSLGIENYEGCLTADLNAGSIVAEVAESAVSDVILKAGVGGTRLLVDDELVKERRRLLVGSKTEWSDGKGECHLQLSTDAGEVRLTLN